MIRLTESPVNQVSWLCIIGKELSQINEKINYFGTAEGRKEIIISLKKEMKKANEKENYLDDEERELIKNFILKIKKELSL